MKIMEMPEFLAGATNVYRMGEYIVKQQIMYRSYKVLGTYLFSRDTYYRCTPKRDREYEETFADRISINGKRISAMVYVRKYID